MSVFHSLTSHPFAKLREMVGQPRVNIPPFRKLREMVGQPRVNIPPFRQSTRNGGAAGEGTLKLLQFEGNDVAIGLAAGLVVDFDEAVGPGAGELIGAKNDEGFVVIGAEGHLFLSGFDG